MVEGCGIQKKKTLLMEDIIFGEEFN